MGKEVEVAARSLDHEVVGVFDADRRLSPESLKEVNPDVAVDFTEPHAVLTNIRVCVKAMTPIVIGTTGWDRDVPKVKSLIEEANLGCVIGSNFSIGVNLFLEIVRQASKLISPAGYDAYILEAHQGLPKWYRPATQ
jgi:4-hydroxy-tetrahydrodipicolinate reductase